jgi:RNA polymerase sigma factor (sigma-70 family)
MARELKEVPTERLLLRAAKSDDPEEFGEAVGELIMRYKSLVYSQALWVCSGNRSLADDVFQETFLRLFNWLKARRGEPPVHSFARLLQVFAKRAAIDMIRKDNRQTPGPVEEFDSHWEDHLYVKELMEWLDERSRQILHFTYFEGLTAPEVAKLLNLKAGHVRTLKFRALEALREWQNRDKIADLLEEL